MAGRKERVLALPAYDQGTIFGPGSEPIQDVFTASATQKHRLGARFIDGDRIFRYAKNSSAATLAKALMNQAQVVAAGTHEIVQTGHTWSADDVSGTMLITTGGTYAVNEFTDGWFMGNKVTTALGDIYRVLASEITSDDTIINLELETPIRNAIGATAEFSLIPNRWYDVVVFPTAHTGYAAGVALVDIAASYYGWLQTAGPAPLLVDDDEAIVIGDSVGNAASTAVAGQCGVRATLEQSWGNVLLVGAHTDDAALINLHIDQ